jgi:hypothetical protein
MKKISALLFLTIPFLSHAQFQKGDKFIEGSFSFQNGSNSQSIGSKNESGSFSINPAIGFLINEKVALGGQIGYNSYSYKNSYTNPTYSYEQNRNSFSAGIFANRYFKISDKFLFSLKGLLSFSRGTETNTNTNVGGGGLNLSTTTDNYQLAANASPNFLFFPSNKWAIEASIGSIGYNYSRNLSNDGVSNYFNLDYGRVSLGVVYFVRKTIE